MFFSASIGLIFASISTREESVERNKALDDEIDAAKSKLSGLLLCPALFVSFCSVCLVAESHETHILKQTEDGTVYRSMHCGRRTPRPALMRLVGFQSCFVSFWFGSWVSVKSLELSQN